MFNQIIKGYTVSKEIIFSFENTADAVHAGKLMKKADSSLRFSQTRATVFITAHENIFEAAKAVSDANIPFSLGYWEDIKAAIARSNQQ